MQIDCWDRRRVCTSVQCHHLFNADLSLLPLLHPCALLFQVPHRKTNRQLLIHSFIIFFSKWINNSKPWGRYARKREVYVEAFAAVQRAQTMSSFLFCFIIFFFYSFSWKNSNAIHRSQWVWENVLSAFPVRLLSEVHCDWFVCFCVWALGYIVMFIIFLCSFSCLQKKEITIYKYIYEYNLDVKVAFAIGWTCKKVIKVIGAKPFPRLLLNIWSTLEFSVKFSRPSKRWHFVTFLLAGIVRGL